jgi:hypothetical protein
VVLQGRIGVEGYPPSILVDRLENNCLSLLFFFFFFFFFVFFFFFFFFMGVAGHETRSTPILARKDKSLQDLGKQQHYH